MLGVARAAGEAGRLPESQHDFAFRFCGLIGFADPLRPEVRDAVAECRSAGIRVVMITGDYPATASAIATQAGLDHQRILTGAEIATLNDDELAHAAQGQAAFARIVNFVHGSSTVKIGLQLGHSGPKGSTRVGWEGTDEPLDAGNWPLLAASPLASGAQNQTPAAMTRDDMDRVTAAFVDSARPAVACGFDWLELH